MVMRNASERQIHRAGAFLMPRLVAALVLFALPAQAVKFWTQIVPAAAGATTIAVNAGSLYRGIKRTPKVVKAIPKGTKAIQAAAKGKK